jgi:hypothetical protein
VSALQKMAWLYCLLFLVVVVITHFPGLTDEEGRNLGLFVIDPVDDVIHTLTAVFAGFAAWQGTRVSLAYFRLFGVMYGIDGVVGFLNSLGVSPLVTGFAANAPHLAIAALALTIGFVVHERLAAT